MRADANKIIHKQPKRKKMKKKFTFGGYVPLDDAHGVWSRVVCNGRWKW